jgi:hypothetical protein
MATSAEGRTPIHLWIVGLLALLWNAFGAYDYTMTRMRNTDYIASAMPGVDPQAALAWVDALPIYAQIGWGLGVWLGLLGSILLLIRSRWAVWSLGISFVGAVVSLGYQIAFAPPIPGAVDSAFMTAMPYVIILITAFLAWYAWTMEKKGVLR